MKRILKCIKNKDKPLSPFLAKIDLENRQITKKFEIFSKCNKTVFRSFVSSSRAVFNEPMMLTSESGGVGMSNKEMKGLKLAPNAVKKIKDLVSKDTEGRTFLRIEVEGGGCSGFQYFFKLVPKENYNPEQDLIFEEDGAKLLCDNLSIGFLDGSTIDWKEELIKSSFRVENNPNSEQSCGCGTSFSVKGT